MEPYPIGLAIAFVATTLLSIILFLRATSHWRIAAAVIGSVAVLQCVLALSGFYTVTDTIPPRIVFLLGPSFLIVGALFITPAGRCFIDGLDLKALTLIHVVRIPVEFILLGLFLHGSIPELMTFEGRNFDIIPGLTAPLIYYLVFVRRSLGKRALLLWNLLSMVILLNIVLHGILSTPFAFQRFAFDQPNVALLYFPFNWLPAIIVPLVLLAHIVAIHALVRKPHSVPAMT